MSTFYSRLRGLLGASVAFWLLLLLPAQVNSQVALYSRTPLSGLDYEQLTGPGVTIIDNAAGLSPSMTNSADDGAALIALPFDFTFNGVDYNEVTMCTNGWVGFGNQLATTAAQGRAPANLFNATAPNNLVAAWFGDGSANFPAPNPGSMRYGLVDTDVFRFQWDQNTGASFNLSTTNLISFHVDIYGPDSPAPGRIIIQYGPVTATPSTGRSIGLGGPGTDYLNALNGLSTSTATASAWPGDGNGYQFDPPINCVTLDELMPGTIVYPGEPCAGASFTLNVNGSETGVIGLSYQWYISTNGIDFTDIIGANGVSYTTTNSNAYYAREISCPASGIVEYTDVEFVAQGFSGPFDAPYFESFEDLVPPYGTTNLPCGYLEQNTVDWFTRSSPFLTGGGFTHVARTGNVFVTTNWSTGAGGDILWLPGINLFDGVSYDVLTWYATDGLSGWQSLEWIVNISQTAVGATVLGAPVLNATNTNYLEFRRSFIPSAEGVYFFGLRVVADGVPWQIAFDDFGVQFSPDCGAPVVTLASACGTSATLNVSPGSGLPLLYEWELVPGGGAQGVNVLASGSGSSPVVLTGLTANTSYRLWVRTECAGGVFSEYGFSNFTTGLVNDCSQDAILLNAPCTSAQPAVSGTTIGATLDADYVDAGAGGTPLTERGVWYLLPGDDNAYTINTCAAISYDTRLSVYTGSPGALIPLVGNDDMPVCSFGLFRSEVTFNAFAGTNYYIFVHGYQFGAALSTVGNFQLNFFCSPLCLPIPANDNCASALSLSPLPASCSHIAVNNQCASPATTPPSCVSQFGTYNDVWYSFVATDASQAFNLQINGSASSIGIAVYNSCGGASFICSTLTSSGEYAIPGLTVGNTYLVQLFTSVSNAGTFSFCVYDGCPFPTSFLVFDATPESISLGWTDNAGASTWDVFYTTTGQVPTDATSPILTGVSTIPVVIDGLSPGTTYTFWVRANCTEDSSSPWAGGISGTTAPLPPVCGGSFVDSGGPGGNYGVDEAYSTVICPDSPGQVVQVTFTQFDVEDEWDYMLIFDGPNMASPQITSSYIQDPFTDAPTGSWTGTLSPGTVTSTHPSGCLTFYFVSDFIIVGPGWNASVQCLGVTVDGTNDVEFCAGDELIASLITTGTFAGDNVFTLELSDENGDFSNSFALGTLNAVTASSIAALIPSSIGAGTGYRVRVLTSNPVTISPEFPVDLIIKTTPVVNLGDDQDICDYETVLLSTGYPDATNEWSTGDLTESILVFSEETFSVTVTLDNGCSASGSVSIQVNPSTPSLLPAIFELCPGDVDIIFAGDFAEITWLSGESTNAIEVSQPGTYSFNGTNLFGCETSGSTEVAFADVPEVDLGGDVILCGEETIILQGPIGDFDYQWNDNSTDATLVVTQGGTYAVVVTNDFGCAGFDEIFVSEGEVPVFELPVQITACEGDEVTIEGPAGFATYEWSTDSSDESITVSESGIYTLTVTNEDGCQASADAEVVINDLPVVDLGDDITAIIGETVTLDAGNGFVSYQWSTDESTQTISVDEGGLYLVTVTDENGCTASDEIEVTFVVTIEEVDGISHVVIYPNPANDFVRVDARLNNAPAMIRITDQSGRLVHQSQTSTFPVMIPVNQLAGGVYHLTLVQFNGRNHTSRLIIAH